MHLKSCLQYLSLLCATALFFACSDNPPMIPEAAEPKMQDSPNVSWPYQALTDSHFKPPNLESLDFAADLPGAAIWGALGRDNEGQIYFGLSNYNNLSDTSHLVQYDPATETFVMQSDTISELKKAQRYFDNTAQIKLHSKFVMAQDGYLYFSSFDETGETDSRNPVYGGNLWRKKPEAESWEHLLATEEALIAVQTDGRLVYALGYWGHALYQYDPLSGQSKREMIGSIDGHVSRNFIVNQRGSVFVPRVERSASGNVIATLVELDNDLNISDIHSLPDYHNPDGYGDHGIVAYTTMKNGDTYFIVASGGLYHISENASARHNVEYLGKFDTQFENSYISSLFSPDGEDMLVGIGRNQSTEGYYWFIRELTSQVSVNYHLEQLPKTQYLLYGSQTVDNFGNLYIVGRDTRNRRKHLPIIIKASYAKTN